MKSELQNVSITYIGESKRSWKSGGRGPEHKPGTNGNVGSAVKQHAETSGHKIHPNYASILETDVKTNEKKALPRVITFIPGQELCQRTRTPPKGLRFTGFLREGQ